MARHLTSTQQKQAISHILLVDDDRRIRQLLEQYLLEHDYRVTCAADAGEARAALRVFYFDALVLDVMMPGETGFAFLKSLRETSDVPVLMLTARAEADDRVEGLGLGSDDYITKPFDPRELLLRLHNIRKRLTSGETAPADIIRFGAFVHSIKRGELHRGDERIRLTDNEQFLLAVLAVKAGEIIPRHKLVRDGQKTSDRAIDVQINRLRQKIEDDPANPRHLQTVRGVGYKLVL